MSHFRHSAGGEIGNNGRKMQVNATSSTGGGLPAGSDRIPMKTLGQEDFLKLVVTQLTTQDPLHPMADTQFIAQMAQFTALEQTKGLQAELAQLRSDQHLVQANALIGREVQLDGAEATSGIVSAVKMDEGIPKLLVDGQLYQLSQVLSIKPSAANSN